MCKIMEEILDEGLEKGRKEGRKEGEMRKSKEIAFNLARQGLSIDSIAMAVEQSVPIVENWIKESGASMRR